MFVLETKKEKKLWKSNRT